MKKSQLDKAVESINEKIRVLQLAREHLDEQREKPASVAKPRAVPKTEAAS